MPIDISTNQPEVHTSHSQTEITDLIGNPPSWLLRSGITMVAIVVTIIMVGAYYFNYPDKLTGSGILTSNTPPIEIISRSTGYIEAIHFKEGDYIQTGDSILYINNTTDQSQLSLLKEWIKEYEEILDPRKILDLPFIEDLQLGGVQGDYANLQLKYNELQQTLKEGVVFQQLNSIDQEIINIKSLNDSQRKEKIIYSKELDLAKKDFARNEALNKDGIVSDLDFERTKTSLLQKERQFEGMNNNIISNTIRIEQLELEKLKLKEVRSNTIKSYKFAISEIISRVRTSIENWNKLYSVESPIAGKITFGKEIKVKRNLKQGQLIGYMMPEKNDQLYVSALYKSNNIGKVEIGQKAILKFDAYPHKEYGVVLSEVGEISKVPELNSKEEPMYELKIPVAKQIVTDYQDTIKYKPSMTVIAEVITEDKSVLERIFKQILSIVNQ